MTPSCPTCRAEAPEGARFCPACGARLEADRPEATERKVVTTLFADLVGSTALGERHDPEDIDAALRAYYTLARAIIERFGGGVEKFIGDAVVGLFGVPAAHGDDAERAVRAALELVARMRELPPMGDELLEVRAAVNTGPALVRLGVLPRSGEGVLVGDAVNTAARLLAAAPPMAVVAGAMTHRLTERVIAYEPLPSITAKGKSKPVERWVARGPIARRGVAADRRDEAPMVGREVELGILDGLLERAIASSSPQFALVTGEAGIGKSRLLREYFRRIDTREGFLCTWRQGRCPPYGSGLAYWPLREIVGAHVGALHPDSPATVLQKLLRALGPDAADAAQVNRLRPLVGLPALHAERPQYFDAWTRFFESMAETRPTMLVIEDIHWASEPVLAFLEHLQRHAAKVPLLVTCTARPEYLLAHPTRPGFTDGVAHIALGALSAAECGRLATSLPGTSTVPDIGKRVAEGCGGNPLFAEELVRYLVERRSGSGGSCGAAGGHETPESVLSLIAARLDSLPATHKAILGDAAVVGQVFWPGALRALGDEQPVATEEILHYLETREFVRRSGDSALEGEDAFAFWHALVRDVAYEQLPRATRAVKHAKLARWIEALAGENHGDLSELLAHHYSAAMDLACAVHDTVMANDLREGAVTALELAGTAVLPLDVSVAERHLSRAVGLADDDSRRPHLLDAWAETLLQGGRFAEAAAAWEEAIPGLRDGGDERAAKTAKGRFNYCHWLIADEGKPTVRDGDEPNAADPPSEESVVAWEDAATTALHAGRNQRAKELAGRALAAAEQLGKPTPLASLCYRGFARTMLGDADGLVDMRESLALARERDAGHDICAALSNLGECLTLYEGTDQSWEVHREALDIARKRRDGLAECFCRSLLLVDQVWAGRWETARAEAPGVLELLERNNDGWDLQIAQATVSQLLVWSGDVISAVGLAERAEERSRSSPLAGVRQASLIALASVRAAEDDAAESLRLLSECTRSARVACGIEMALRAPEAIRLAVGLGRPLLAHSLAAPLRATRPYDAGTLAFLEGLLHEGGGEAEAAAERFAAAERQWVLLGVPYERAQAALARGRCLMRLDDAEKAAPVLVARDIFAALGARPAQAEAEALLT